MSRLSSWLINSKYLFKIRVRTDAMTLLLVILTSLYSIEPCISKPTVLDTYDSPYNHVIVQQEGDIVSFKRMENGSIVSAIDLSNPARQVVVYTPYLFVPALFHPAPQKVLNVGMGAGAINRLIAKLYPDTLLVSVEIDPMIVKVAVKYTKFAESENNQVVVRDGRVFLRRDKRKWDWIIIDAFVKRSQIPPHLTTMEFYQLVSERLTESGVMAINLHSGSRLFDCQAATLQEAFHQVLFFRVGNSGNVIAIGANYTEPALLSVLEGINPETLPDASAYDVNFEEMKNALIPLDAPMLNQPCEVLTDDYAPVEFLELLKSDSLP